MPEKHYLPLPNGQVSILDDPRPIAEAVKDKRYNITSIITKGISNMEKIKASARLTRLFLEDARLFHPIYVAWRHGLLRGQARVLIAELENQAACQ